MGILDMFDNPDLLSQLFGISPANASPRAPTPTPPFDNGAPLQGGALGSPTPVQTSSLGPGGGPPAPPPPMAGNLTATPKDYDFGPHMSFDQRAAPIQADIANGVTDPVGANYTDFSANPNQPQPPGSGGGTLPSMAPNSNVAGPGVIPRPISPPPAPNGGIQTADASGRVPLPGQGQAAAPPPASVMAQPGGPPMTATSGGLMNSLGLNPNAMRIGLAGVGRGLSAVGSQPDGTSAGRSFAAGAGGALTGSNQQVERDQAQARQAQNDLFNQQSGYFKDMLAAKASDSTADYRAAQSKWLLARAQAQMVGGGSGNDLLNSPIRKVTWVEGQALKYRDQIRKTAEKNAAISEKNGEVKPIDEDAIEKATDAFRRKLYQSPAINMDPDKAEKIKNMGVEAPTTQDGKQNSKFNPFDTRSMSEDDFNTHVPMGAWYLNQNGDPRQRTKPPPSMTPQAQSTPGGYPAADELMATSPV